MRQGREAVGKEEDGIDQRHYGKHDGEQDEDVLRQPFGVPRNREGGRAEQPAQKLAAFSRKPETGRTAQDAGREPPDKGGAEQRPKDASLRIAPVIGGEAHEPDDDEPDHKENACYESPVAFFPAHLFLSCARGAAGRQARVPPVGRRARFRLGGGRVESARPPAGESPFQRRQRDAGGGSAPGGLAQVAHLTANAHEHVHFMPPQAGFAEKTAQGHEEIVGIVVFEKVDGEKRFLEPGIEEGLFLMGDAPRLLAGIVGQGGLGIGSAHGLHALVGEDEDGLRQIERRGVPCRGDGHEPLALFDVGVAEAPVLTAEDDGDAVSLVQQGRDFFRRTFGREQSAPPPARAGRGADGQNMGRERLRQRFLDFHGVQQGLALGRSEGAGFFLVPPRGRDEGQPPAAHIGAGAGGHADVFGKLGSHHDDFQMAQGVLRGRYEHDHFRGERVERAWSSCPDVYRSRSTRGLFERSPLGKMAVTGMLTLSRARSSACASGSGRVRSTLISRRP